MSDWPKRYDSEVDRDGVIIGLTDEVPYGDWVSSEDFDYLLMYCAEIVKRDTKGYSELPLSEIRTSILIEMERYIKEN